MVVKTRAHRIYVEDEAKNPIGVISLGDILAVILHSI